MTRAIPYYDWISHHAARRPDHRAVLELDTGRNFTYAALDRRATRLAAWLQGIGIGRGDRVALFAQNGVEYFDLQFACGRIGAVMLPLNWRLALPELEFILGDAAPGLLIHSRHFRDSAEALHRLGTVARLLEIADDGTAGSYEQALEECRSAPFVERLTHEDVSTIMYTSGTTGHPKGAIITHGMTFWNAVNLGIPAMITPATVQLVVLPLFHTGGLNCYANPVLHAGGTLLLMRAFEPGPALKHLSDPALGITHFFAVPAPYQFMMQHSDFAKADLSRIAMAGVGGAPCALAILETWAAKGVPLVQGYGMTETSPAVTMLDAADAIRKVGSAGKPLLHTEVRIVDETGRDVGAGEIGELWTRGPNITPGYWNRPDATAQSFHDGWLRTGDAARLDGEGFIYIVDRWKDMYISGGENVYPAEVENVLYQLPQVAEAAVIGVPDARWGEVGKAVLVLKPGASLDAGEVVSHCLARLAKFKVPQTIAFTDALPRNATGKVLKRELRERHAGASAPAIP
ncbi:MAG: long-chain fatty acid--CoA ligase [Alphaproteobacteria bacterium]|nr:long-chain fatty acid--CoA ligase [Alphaproteobacteria bacterium]